MIAGWLRESKIKGLLITELNYNNYTKMIPESNVVHCKTWFLHINMLCIVLLSAVVFI